MTDRRKDDVGVPEALPIEELIAGSSIGGEMDPELDDVCTDDDAAEFVAQFDARRSDESTDHESTHHESPSDGGSDEHRARRYAAPQQVFVSHAVEPFYRWDFAEVLKAELDAREVLKAKLDAREAMVTHLREIASAACARSEALNSMIALLKKLRRRVNQTDFFNFDSRLEEARFFVVNDLLPLRCPSPVLSTPLMPEDQQRRLQFDDDIALVLDTSLVSGSGVPPPRHEVYWPSQVHEAHQEFYYRLRDAFHRVDLAPHCHLSAIQPTGARTGSPRTLALLWRVVNPSRAVAVRDQNFAELLEQGLASWRPQFQQLISQGEDVPAALLSAVAGDRYWAGLGLRASAQLCAHRENGELDNSLTATSWRFLTDALQDARRWFPFANQAIRDHASPELEEAQSVHPVEAADYERPAVPMLPQPELWGGHVERCARSDDTQVYPMPNPLGCGPNRGAPQPSREWS